MKNKSTSRSGQRRGGESDASKAARDNRADQLNPNNDKFHRARGLTGRPDGSEGGSPPSPRKRLGLQSISRDGDAPGSSAVSRDWK